MKNLKYLNISTPRLVYRAYDLVTSFDCDETLVAGLLCCFLPVVLRPTRRFSRKHTPPPLCQVIWLAWLLHVTALNQRRNSWVTHTHTHCAQVSQLLWHFVFVVGTNSSTTSLSWMTCFFIFILDAGHAPYVFSMMQVTVFIGHRSNISET